MHWDSIPENGSSLCQQVSIADGLLITGVTQRPFSRLRTRTLSGLTLCRSWVCCHRVCELMCTWSLEREQGDSRWVLRVNVSMELGVGGLGEGRHDQTTAYEKYLKLKKLKTSKQKSQCKPYLTLRGISPGILASPYPVPSYSTV